MKKYMYNNEVYKAEDLAKLAVEVLGEDIFDALVTQIRQGAVRYSSGNSLELTDIEKKVKDLRDNTFLSYRGIANKLGITPNEASYLYRAAITKIDRKKCRGKISSLNVSGRLYNCMKFIMDGKNSSIDDFYKKINANYDILILCNGIGHVSYNDIIVELESLGYDVSRAPRFANVFEFTRYKNNAEMYKDE